MHWKIQKVCYQGSTLTLTRFQLESKFASWSKAIENEPKYLPLPNLRSKFWVMLDGNFYTKILTCVQKISNDTNDHATMICRLQKDEFILVFTDLPPPHWSTEKVAEYTRGVMQSKPPVCIPPPAYGRYVWRTNSQKNEPISISSYDNALHFGK